MQNRFGGNMYDNMKKVLCNAFRPLGQNWARFVYVDATAHAQKQETLANLDLEKKCFNVF